VLEKSPTLPGELPFMPQNTYRALPLEALYELLVSSVRDMLNAFETKQDNMIAFNAIKKQVEVIIQLIEEKRRELKN
jgi:hypothetical protein